MAASLAASGTSKSGSPIERLIGSFIFAARSKTLRMPEASTARARDETESAGGGGLGGSGAGEVGGGGGGHGQKRRSGGATKRRRVRTSSSSLRRFVADRFVALLL